MNLIQDQEILISVNGIVKQFFFSPALPDDAFFSPALPDDASAILSLYRSHIGREFCAWTDDYPSADTIRFDLARNSLFCLKTTTGHDLAGVISFDADPETDILDCWSKELVPSVEFARVAVSLNYQGRGIAGRLFTCAMEEAKRRGFRSAHYLVAKTNEKALRAYRKLQFSMVGECVYHGVDYWCCEKEL